MSSYAQWMQTFWLLTFVFLIASVCVFRWDKLWYFFVGLVAICGVGMVVTIFAYIWR